MTRLARCVASLSLALAVSTEAGALAQQRAQAGGAVHLTPEERERLEAGFLVTRPRSERRGDLWLIGGTSFQLIDLPVAAVWSEVEDPANYWKFLPAARETRETSRESDEDRTVFIRHTYGAANAAYHVRMHFDPEKHTVLFRLADDLPHNVRAGWGFFHLIPWSNHRTLVAWGVLADPGHGLLVDAFRPRIGEMLLRVPLKLRRHLGFADPEPGDPIEPARGEAQDAPPSATEAPPSPTPASFPPPRP